MGPIIWGGIGPGFLNQVPTLTGLGNKQPFISHCWNKFNEPPFRNVEPKTLNPKTLSQKAMPPKTHTNLYKPDPQPPKSRTLTPEP